MSFDGSVHRENIINKCYQIISDRLAAQEITEEQAEKLWNKLELMSVGQLKNYWRNNGKS